MNFWKSQAPSPKIIKSFREGGLGGWPFFKRVFPQQTSRSERQAAERERRRGRGQRGETKKADSLWLSALSSVLLLSSTLNLTGTQASWASVNVARSSVNYGLYPLNVRLPCSVRSSVRVRHLDTESYTLSAKIALCHDVAPPFPKSVARGAYSHYPRYHIIITYNFQNCKTFSNFF